MTAPPDRFSLRMRKAAHVFSAGHFITLSDDLCEAVHGHNWTVAVEVDADADAHGMVIDFLLLRDRLTDIVRRLDHAMLLPTQSRHLVVTTETGPLGEAEVTVRFQNRRWVFPAAECRLLPLANTTAEWLARWIGGELSAALCRELPALSGRIRVEVDECLGQSGVWETSIGSG